MIASKPGQYIHSTLITVTTITDGEIVLLISVDNYSKFCFKPSLIKELTQTEVENHIKNLLKEIKSQHRHIKPKIFLSYGKKFIHELILKFKENCTLEFNPIVAEEIVSPVAKSFLSYRGFNPKNN